MNDKPLYAVPLDGKGEEWEFYDDLGDYLDMRIANMDYELGDYES